MIEPMTGCYKCEELEWIGDDSSDGFSGNSGYNCKKRDTDHFKVFPCKRMLKCFVPEPIFMGSWG